MLQMLSRRSETGAAVACKRGLEPSEDGWRHGEPSSVGVDAGRWKQACYRVCGAGEEDKTTSLDGKDNSWNDVMNVGGAEVEESISDPVDAVGGDIVQYHILSLLDARSLARSAAVCARWRNLAIGDKLWESHVIAFLLKRPLLPLYFLNQDVSSMSQFQAYTVAVMDCNQRELSPAEMCGRTWEIRLKPTCGPYWLGLDPSQLGYPGLQRFFHCDGSITAGPNDPIWGGQETVWRYLRVKGRDGCIGQHVQINRWPLLRVSRLKDGRWFLENLYATYVTRSDNPAFSPGVRSREKKACCKLCTAPTYGIV